MIMNSFDMCD